MDDGMARWCTEVPSIMYVADHEAATHMALFFVVPVHNGDALVSSCVLLSLLNNWPIWKIVIPNASTTQ
jgi:hypothetical protein